MTACDGGLAEHQPRGAIETFCSKAANGRRASRALAAWAKRFGLSEAEFQVVWRLGWQPDGSLDQTALANRLVFSAAQISATVERLRSRGLIVAHNESADRRRQHWQLATAGKELLAQLLAAEALLSGEATPPASQDPGADRRREAAA